jgi:hypothetical protein
MSLQLTGTRGAAAGSGKTPGSTVSPVRARDSQAATAASYQLMASYLVWDLRDLLERQQPKKGWQRRVQDLEVLFEAADRGGRPLYPPPNDLEKSGGLRANRARQLETLEHDDEIYGLVKTVAGTATATDTLAWATAAREALSRVLDSDGQVGKSDRTFLCEQVEPFLRRLQRVDQLDEYSPPRRSAYVIRR